MKLKKLRGKGAPDSILFWNDRWYSLFHMAFDTLPLLLAELNTWAKIGMTTQFWWRDDDAGKPCEALEHLLRLSADDSVPCGLAAIPKDIWGYNT